MAREVGTEGILGGQARVPGVAGTWKDLTESVNRMASNLTGQVRQHRRGDHGGRPRRPVQEDRRGRARRDPGAEDHHQHDGRTSCRPSPTRSPGWPARWAPRASWAARRGCRDVAGTWKDLTESVNEMAGNLTRQVRAIAAGRHRGDPRRPQPADRRGRGRRDPGAPGQHQHDDRQPARDHARQQGAGLAQGQPGPDLRSDAGPPRPRATWPR